MSGQTTAAPAQWGLTDRYALALPKWAAPAAPARFPDARPLLVNGALARDLGLDPATVGPDVAAWLTGDRTPEGTPVAQAYAGHQFGGYSPILGDGRALLLGELDTDCGPRDVALKGSGPTAFARRGDGLAGLGPVLREYILSEAMHALGIPTTRALAALETGRPVVRHPPEPGAVLVRVAASHLRVGSFQLVASQGDANELRAMADFAIARHYPGVDAAHPGTSPERYLAFLDAVIGAQAELVAAWTAVGFVHGVMNTDNTSISGETLDYGPAAFLEAYRPDAVYSSIDTGGRYAFNRQPSIALWNLARLAESLLPILGAAPKGSDADPAVEGATEVLATFAERYEEARLVRLRAKLGLAGDDAGDAELVDDFLALLADAAVDYTLAWRRLADSLLAETDGAEDRLRSALTSPELSARYDDWRARYLVRRESGALTPDEMDAVNPLYIPRNYAVEAALAAARVGDLDPTQALLAAVTSPYEAHVEHARYAEPAPPGFDATYITYCGT